MKRIIAIILALVLIVALCGCNKQVFDLNYNFKYAVLQRADGEQLIKIESWKDFDDGDQIQFTSVDGVTYLVHSSNVILLSDLEKTS